MLSTTWSGVWVRSSFSASDRFPLHENTTKATANAVAIVVSMRCSLTESYLVRTVVVVVMPLQETV